MVQRVNIAAIASKAATVMLMWIVGFQSGTPPGKRGASCSTCRPPSSRHMRLGGAFHQLCKELARPLRNKQIRS